VFTLLMGDMVVLLLTLMGVAWIRLLLGGFYKLELYLQLWPILLLFPVVFAFLGLYPAVGLSVPEELRRIFIGTTIVFLLLGSSSFLLQNSDVYSRAVFLVAWVIGLVAVPLNRALLRHLVARQPWWGYPVVILGAGQTGQAVAAALHKQPGLGLKAIGFLDDDPNKQGEMLGLPVLGNLEGAVSLAHHWKIRHAILAIPSASRARLLEVIERYGSVFPRLTLIPDLFGMASLWVSATDMGGILGLELRHNLLEPYARLLKRGIDVLAVVLAGVLLLPLLVVLALLIKLDSRGPVFFSHQRLGKQGRGFRAWKFRTMVQNADAVLTHTLETRPQLRLEWERDQKLRNDPRITRMGRWLRRTSLDELPQIWNVLMGEMSLVGPRPIVQAELDRYGERFGLISQVLPGITGLWQVSGRNDTSYVERVALDTYYVRNWSPWLDFYVLARTVWAVLMARGAY
jgi:Undecaprenyl-phosphate galactose phosphotransferase WbaP